MDKETRDCLQRAADERKSIYVHRDLFEKQVLQRLTAIETTMKVLAKSNGIWLHYLINVAAVGVAIWSVLKKTSG